MTRIVLDPEELVAVSKLVREGAASLQLVALRLRADDVRVGQLPPDVRALIADRRQQVIVELQRQARQLASHADDLDRRRTGLIEAEGPTGGPLGTIAWWLASGLPARVSTTNRPANFLAYARQFARAEKSLVGRAVKAVDRPVPKIAVLNGERFVRRITSIVGSADDSLEIFNEEFADPSERAPIVTQDLGQGIPVTEAGPGSEMPTPEASPSNAPSTAAGTADHTSAAPPADVVEGPNDRLSVPPNGPPSAVGGPGDGPGGPQAGVVAAGVAAGGAAAVGTAAGIVGGMQAAKRDRKKDGEESPDGPGTVDAGAELSPSDRSGRYSQQADAPVSGGGGVPGPVVRNVEGDSGLADAPAAPETRVPAPVQGSGLDDTGADTGQGSPVPGTGVGPHAAARPPAVQLLQEAAGARGVLLPLGGIAAAAGVAYHERSRIMYASSWYERRVEQERVEEERRAATSGLSNDDLTIAPLATLIRQRSSAKTG